MLAIVIVPCFLLLQRASSKAEDADATGAALPVAFPQPIGLALAAD
jgi:hypothetical protein